MFVTTDSPSENLVTQATSAVKVCYIILFAVRNHLSCRDSASHISKLIAAIRCLPKKLLTESFHVKSHKKSGILKVTLTDFSDLFKGCI